MAEWPTSIIMLLSQAEALGLGWGWHIMACPLNILVRLWNLWIFLEINSCWHKIILARWDRNSTNPCLVVWLTAKRKTHQYFRSENVSYLGTKIQIIWFDSNRKFLRLHRQQNSRKLINILLNELFISNEISITR